MKNPVNGMGCYPFTLGVTQKQQQFPICPNPKDPDACNVCKGLKFPPEIYESITEYHEEKAEAQD
jgi:hypothetical protein